MPHALPGAGDACLFADVGERAVAVVVIQHVFAVVGDVKVGPAVVVVVADADALAPAGVDEAGFFRDVGERAVVIVVIKMIRCGFPRLARLSSFVPFTMKMSGQPSLSASKIATPVPVVSMMYFFVVTPPKVFTIVRPAFFATSVK